MILIRGDKVAFSNLPGSYSDTTHNGFDLTETMVPGGWFIPCADHGMQAMYLLSKGSPLAMTVPGGMMNYTPGNKGLLCSPAPEGANFNLVRVMPGSKVNLTPLVTGTQGHAIITTFDHLEELMMMAIRLTKTIEEAVSMYCRHTPNNIRHVEIMSKKDIFEFMRKHYAPRIKKMLEEEKE